MVVLDDVVVETDDKAGYASLRRTHLNVARKALPCARQPMLALSLTPSQGVRTACSAAPALLDARQARARLRE